jgi:hypothetical protein
MQTLKSEDKSVVMLEATAQLPQYCTNVSTLWAVATSCSGVTQYGRGKLLGVARMSLLHSNRKEDDAYTENFFTF